MKTGRYSIAKLLTSPEVEQIIIPELQRDYVWGTRNVRGLLSSILDNYSRKEEQTLQITDSKGNQIEGDILNFLNEEYMRLRYNTRIGFIYAYHDRSLSNQFYLIDGQQRITTIFLILLALYRRSDIEQFRKKYFASSAPRLDYKVREVAHSFLVDFIEFELTRKEADKTFRDDSRYYNEYDKDITAQSIYSNYYDVIVPALSAFDNVESIIDYVENYIEFNYFDTNISEQGEKLYLYMNSRGESLSVQERVKSIIVGRSADKLSAGKQWEDWQNFFWRIKPDSDKNADRGFLEFLKWAVVLHLCKYADTKIKKTEKTDSTEKSKSRIEEIEDYIRVENDESKKARQEDWIFLYITENKSFTFDWLQQTKTAVDCMYGFLRTPDFNAMNFEASAWFGGLNDTIEYVPLLSLLYYIMSFNITAVDSITALRAAMYFKNLKSEYILRRNPDRAVIRSLGLVDWMAKYRLKDIRLAGRQAKLTEDDLPDKYLLRPDDLRWEYYLTDRQNSQHTAPQPDCVGRWEAFFWQITNNRNLNRFMRGNHDFIIRVMQHGALSAEEYLELFTKNIFEQRNSDNLRKELLEYGDISIYDDGGSGNIGPNWMGRRCLLGSNNDETYWDTFFNGKYCNENSDLVASYLLNYQSKKEHNEILEEIGDNLQYMHQKYYLWSRTDGQRERYILLNQKQASKTKAQELCVRHLHNRLPGSWIWEHNCCVINFDLTPQGLTTDVEDSDKSYYIDIWYDWAEKGGKWYCRIGHREHDLSEEMIALLQQRGQTIGGLQCNWQPVNTSHIILETATPIYTEKVDDDYFAGSKLAQQFATSLLALLNPAQPNPQ